MNDKKETEETPNPDSSRLKRIVHFALRPMIGIPLIVVMLLCAAPFMYRSYRINQLPDIDHPFDLEAFLNFEVPDEENAYVEYNQAEKKLVTFKGKSEILEKALREGWEKTPQDVKDWLKDNRETIKIWKKGTEKPDAQYQVMKDMTLATFSPPISYSQDLAQLATLEANRLTAENNLQAAWKWNLAFFRYSRHLGQHGLALERLVGIAVFGVYDSSFQKWLENPNVDADLLRKALKELENSFQMTAPIIENFKAEYTFAIRLCDIDYATVYKSIGGTFFGSESRFSEWSLYLRGEPELGRRVTKHVMTNWLLEIEKSPWERKKTIPGSFELFDIENKRLGENVFDPRQIQKVAMKSDLAKMALFSQESLEEAVLRDQANYHCLRIAIAAEIHQREHGSYPAKLEELKVILGEIPYDPLYASSKRDLQYRKEKDGYVVWSVGWNGIDNGGDVLIGQDHKAGEDIGFRIFKKEPRPSGSVRRSSSFDL